MSPQIVRSLDLFQDNSKDFFRTKTEEYRDLTKWLGGEGRKKMSKYGVV
jgi:hypothetical protein